MNLKKQVGIESAKYVESGMIVGLGTGSTAYYMIEELGRRVKEEGLDIVGIPTSVASKQQAEALGIKIVDVDDVSHVDLTIDGADEIDPNLNGIKGGGAALLFEKVVANISKKIIWIADDSKKVNHLGKFPLPIEVVQYGSKQVFNRFEEKGYKPTYRMKDGNKHITDSGNYIIDLHLDIIENPSALAIELKSMVGVIEHGLFINRCDIAIFASGSGIEVVKRAD